MEKAQSAMVRLMIKAKEAAGPSGSSGSHCPRWVLPAARPLKTGLVEFILMYSSE